MFFGCLNILLCFYCLVYVTVQFGNVNGSAKKTKASKTINFNNHSRISSLGSKNNGTQNGRRFDSKMFGFDPEDNIARSLKKYGMYGFMKVKTTNFFEPYWKYGNRAFSRSTTTLMTQPTTTKSGSTYTTTPTIPQIKQFCEMRCTSLFLMYGAICAKRIIHRKGRMTYSSYSYYAKPQDWEIEFKSFEDICHMQEANCNTTTKSWTISYRGNCRNTAKVYPYPPNAAKMVSSMRFHHQQGIMKTTTEMTDFEFVKPTRKYYIVS